MKLILTLLVGTISVTSFAEDISWDKYRGCYQVLSINGVDLPAGVETEIGTRNRSSYDYYTEFWSGMHDPNATLIGGFGDGMIPGFNIPLPVEYNNSVLYYNRVPVFTDRGTFTTDAQGDHYKFDGLIQTSNVDETGYVKTNGHVLVDILPSGKEMLMITMSRRIDGPHSRRHSDLSPTSATLKRNNAGCDCDSRTQLCSPH